ncbi:sensor histidine kinase [Planosporangium thailandense]|uniref:histidine kinase n=1 Tax=Planosporangium thailandense TaxID=765197 RepID=A0ABX0XX96_9ACTN|nr:sensor histidine kinase [Planosporangium thailandense]
MKLATQTMVLQVVVIAVLAGVGFLLVTTLLRAELERQFQHRALAVAQTVAARPGLGDEVRTGRPDPDGAIQRYAEQVRHNTHALFVVITDDAGIRYSHTDTGQIGKRVSTDPSAALAGHSVTNIERGTLGPSARGKVPLRDASGRIVGEVSVGIDTDEVTRRLDDLLPIAELSTGVALVVGVLGAALLAARLKRHTLGLEPADLADLLREQVAVLEGIGEGVLAVDPAGRVRVCNAEAVRILGTSPGHVDELPTEARALLTDEAAVVGALRVVGDRVVRVTRRPVRRVNRDLGLVLTLRDRTDLDGLSRELEATRALTDALRAQAHEYTNRLHALTGMLQLGHTDEARAYLSELAGESISGGQLADPYLDGMLTAKAAVASENGVTLRLGEDTWVPGRVTAPLDAVTVVGNLVDNAIRAAAAGLRRPAWVEISLLAEHADLHIYVADSGSGVPAEHAADLFRSGFTTSADTSRPHGLGLSIARQTARNHGGDVTLRSTGADAHGAVFTAVLPGVLEPEHGLAWQGSH